MEKNQVFEDSAFREFLAQLTVANEEWSRFAEDAPAGLTGLPTEDDMHQAVTETWSDYHPRKKLLVPTMLGHESIWTQNSCS